MEVYALMSVKTSNIYGKITISDKTIKKYIAGSVSDCYGIVKFVPRNFLESFKTFFKFGVETKGVKVKTSGDRIFVEICTIVKYGVSIKAVVEALKESTKYKVERFTGMICDTINVKVASIQK